MDAIFVPSLTKNKIYIRSQLKLLFHQKVYLTLEHFNIVDLDLHTFHSEQTTDQFPTFYVNKH